MKKLYTILALMTLAQFGFSQFTHTNYAIVDAYEVLGNFDSYNWSWIGQDSQDVRIDVTFNGTAADLSTSTMGWKMSRQTGTGKVDYVIVLNADITATTNGQVTFSVASTNIPPDNTYKTELFAYQGVATNPTRTLAQGLVDVRQSLYESDNLFTFPSVTGLLEYVRKDGDFSQFTGLGGTAGQHWEADGAGGGSWETPTSGDITAVVAGTGLTGFGTSGSVTGSLDSASIASLALADTAVQPNDSPIAVGTLLSIESTASTASLTESDGGNSVDIYNANLTAGGTTSLDWSNFTLKDDGAIWTSEGTATTGQQIVNFSTMDAITSPNTTHRTSNGSDHSYLDQAVTVASSPEFGAVELTGTTNVVQDTLTLNGTNYISWVLSGSSVTNLLPLVY